VSLRARLALAVVLLAVVVASSALAVLTLVHNSLVNEVDGQIASAARATVGPPAPKGATLPLAPPNSNGSASRFTQLYIAVYERDRHVGTVLKGLDVGPGPAVSYVVARARRTSPARVAPFNAVSADGQSAYRAAAVTLPQGRLVLIAIPTRTIDSTYGQVRLGMVLVGVLLAATLALTWWWVVRLGLRPIKQVTATAVAIAGGDLGRRVETQPHRTEAGQLAQAFNVMLDERQAADQRLRQFVADASHELRTPLATVRGVLELYRSGTLDDLDEALRRASEETDRMAILVRDLLLLAQLDQGVTLTHNRVDLGRVVTDSAIDLRVRQSARRVELKVSPNPFVTGDEARLRQVVANLVGNALDHTPADATISLSVERLGNLCVLTVSDDGPGMTREESAHVFDRFYRVDRARARGHGGSGLGLSIVASIVEAHHGTVSVDTSLGKGVTFRVALPCEHGDSGLTTAGPAELSTSFQEAL